MPALHVRPVRTRREEKAFLEFPYGIYGEDLRWVPPLRLTERQRWQAKHNPALGRLRWTRLVAWDGGKPVGRIAAMVDPLFHRWVPGAGFFGFLECVEDAAVSQALLAAAEDVLREWGCSRCVGPVHQTTHDEVGLLVEGFHIPPTLLSPYNPPFYPVFVAQAGYETDRDYLAFEWTPSTSPHPAIGRLARVLDVENGRFRGLRLRSLDVSRWDDEIETLHELYNTCFQEVWGFVDLSLADFQERAKSFRPFYRPDMAILAEHGGEAVGFSLILPDINTVLANLGGRLLPLGWLAAKRGILRINSGRFILIGVRPEYEGRAVAPAMVLLQRHRVIQAGYESVEVSLVLAENHKMLRVVEALGCRQTKTYRLFGKDI